MTLCSALEAIGCSTNKLRMISVDYRKPVTLPSGAVHVLEHRPLNKNAIEEVYFSRIAFAEIPFGMNGIEFVAQHKELHFCDARILEELLTWITSASQNSGRTWVDRLSCFMRGKYARVYFFGTLFEDDRDRIVVSLLNAVERPGALRFQTFYEQPITSLTEEIVPNFAAVFSS